MNNCLEYVSKIKVLEVSYESRRYELTFVLFYVIGVIELYLEIIEFLYT